MKTAILTQTQKLFLELFGKRAFSRKFYLSGGTALTEFYIPYRFSEDLDFFSEQEVQVDEVIAFIASVKKRLGFKNFDYNTSFNRNIFFLHFPDYNLKLEFTYYPFTQLNSPKKEYGVKIDGVEDIAVNKLFTIYQNPRSRDFMDLYMIIKKYGFSIENLIRKAKIKFDWHVDPIKLGSQFLLVTDLKDYPTFIEQLKEIDWQDFFKKEAKKLKEKIMDQ
jgi:predicted nucleotidyltransferase component of viral defense system